MIFGEVLQHCLACRNGLCDQILLEIVTQKSSKILSKIASGGSSEPPEWLREASGTALGTLPSSARVLRPKSADQHLLFGHFWAQNGARPDP